MTINLAEASLSDLRQELRRVRDEKARTKSGDAYHALTRRAVELESLIASYPERRREELISGVESTLREVLTGATAGTSLRATAEDLVRLVESVLAEDK